MAIPVADPFSSLEQSLSAEAYNYERYRPGQLVDEMRRTIAGAGVQPGAGAPDFELQQVDGAPIRLSGLGGQPLLIRFGSPS